MTRRKTTEEFKNEVYELVGDEYTVIGEYVNNKTKIKMRHNKCGNKYEAIPHDFLANKGKCPYCNYTNKVTHETFLYKFKQKGLDKEFKILSKYESSKTKIQVQCLKCHHKYFVTPNHLLDGKKCPNCSRKKSSNIFKDQVHNMTNGEYTVLGVYEGEYTPVFIRHNKCGYEWEVTPRYFLKGTRCPKCAGNLPFTKETILEKVNKEGNNEYEVIKFPETINNRNKITILHKPCNKTYDVRPYNFFKGNRCPFCSNSSKISKAETEIYEYIRSIYNGKIIRSYRSKRLTNNKELDIYIPDLNLGIEYDGLYWHSNEYREDSYHINKTEFCERKGIKVLHILENEWKFNRKYIQSLLQYYLSDKKYKIGNNYKISKNYITFYTIKGKRLARLTYKYIDNANLIIIIDLLFYKKCNIDKLISFIKENIFINNRIQLHLNRLHWSKIEFDRYKSITLVDIKKPKRHSILDDFNNAKLISYDKDIRLYLCDCGKLIYEVI